MSRQRKGDKAELMACAWLLGRGYQVFRNVGKTGPADIVAWRIGAIPILIDVKYWAKKRKTAVPPPHLAVRILYVMEHIITFDFEEVRLKS